MRAEPPDVGARSISRPARRTAAASARGWPCCLAALRCRRGSASRSSCRGRAVALGVGARSSARRCGHRRATHQRRSWIAQSGSQALVRRDLAALARRRRLPRHRRAGRLALSLARGAGGAGARPAAVGQDHRGDRPGAARAPGPAVSTSTKPDVLRRDRRGALAARAACGCLTRPAHEPGAGGESAALVAGRSARATWDGALLMARAMVTGAGVGAARPTQSHWAKRAQALLAPLLHAAALDGRGIDDGGRLGAAPRARRARHRCSSASRASTGVRRRWSGCRTPRRGSAPRSSPPPPTRWTPTPVAGALAAAERSELRRRRVRALAATRSTSTRPPSSRRSPRRWSAGCWPRSAARPTTPTAPASSDGRVLFALDEVGEHRAARRAAADRLRRRRARPRAARRLPGPQPGPRALGHGRRRVPDPVRVKADPARDRRRHRRSRRSRSRWASTTARWSPPTGGGRGSARTCSAGHSPRSPTTISTQRQRVLSPGEIANIPAGHALHLDGVALGAARAHPRPPRRAVAHAHPASRTARQVVDAATPAETAAVRLRRPGRAGTSWGRLRPSAPQCVECVPGGWGRLAGRQRPTEVRVVLTVAKVTAGGGRRLRRVPGGPGAADGAGRLLPQGRRAGRGAGTVGGGR